MRFNLGRNSRSVTYYERFRKNSSSKMRFHINIGLYTNTLYIYEFKVPREAFFMFLGLEKQFFSRDPQDYTTVLTLSS